MFKSLESRYAGDGCWECVPDLYGAREKCVWTSECTSKWQQVYLVIHNTVESHATKTHRCRYRDCNQPCVAPGAGIKNNTYA